MKQDDEGFKAQEIDKNTLENIYKALQTNLDPIKNCLMPILNTTGMRIGELQKLFADNDGHICYGLLKAQTCFTCPMYITTPEHL